VVGEVLPGFAIPHQLESERESPGCGQNCSPSKHLHREPCLLCGRLLHDVITGMMLFMLFVVFPFTRRPYCTEVWGHLDLDHLCHGDGLPRNGGGAAVRVCPVGAKTVGHWMTNDGCD
jgi:hypothetical protein